MSVSKSTGVIELRTLGQLDLTDRQHQEATAVLRQPKRVALLTYLAFSHGFQRRDSLLFLFWPELNESRARRALRQALHFLRRNLDDDVIGARGTEEIRLNKDLFWCDALAFEKALSAGAVQSAMDFYRGDFLSGFHVPNVAADFEFWISQQRLRLNILAQQGFSSLADAEEEAGNLAGSLLWIRRGLALDPCDEPLVRHLISVLQQSGDRVGAQREYETFSLRLEEECGTEPAEKTQRLVAVPQGNMPNRVARQLALDIAPRPFPRPLTRVIGRTTEIKDVLNLLQKEETSLLTLTGTAGCGKTRLALEIVSMIEDRFESGVCFVPLGAIRSAREVSRAVADALGINHPTEASADQATVNALRDREILLLLDSMEHVTDAAPWVAKLLRLAPSASALVTSRSTLNVAGEVVFRVPPLTLPKPGRAPYSDLPFDSEAMALFMTRAQALSPSFSMTMENADSIAQICRRLDGLPLAIELAAARTNVLSPVEILQRLDRRFDLLREGQSDAPGHHRTLEETLSWSYDLLESKQKELFASLSVFRGGFSLDAVESIWFENGDVSALEELSSLVNKSLVQRTDSEKSRYFLLDTLRDYATLKLETSGRAEKWRDEHAKHFASWVQRGANAYCTEEQSSWFDQLALDHENLKTALEWSCRSDRWTLAGRLSASLAWFWWSHGYVKAGQGWLQRVLQAPFEIAPVVRADVLMGAGGLASAQGCDEKAVKLLEEGLGLYRQMNDKEGEARALQNLGFSYRELGDFKGASDAFETVLTLARSLDDDYRIVVAICSLGGLARIRGDYERAESLLRESLTVAEDIGEKGRIADIHLELGHVWRETGNRDDAKTEFVKSLGLYEDIAQEPNIARTLLNLAETEILEAGGNESAVTHLTRALQIYREIHYKPGIIRALLTFARVALLLGRAEACAKLLGGLDRRIRELEVMADNRFEKQFRIAVESTRKQLNKASFSSLWDSGRSMSLQQLTSFALDTVPVVSLRMVSR